LKDLHTGEFTISYKSWGPLRVRHIRNFDNDTVRLCVIEGDDKDATFCVSREAMNAAIAATD